LEFNQDWNAALDTRQLMMFTAQKLHGGVGFETSSAECGMEQCWGQKPITTRLDNFPD
jgi:hypothetical protein